jgi:hypothetical protein
MSTQSTDDRQQSLFAGLDTVEQAAGQIISQADINVFLHIILARFAGRGVQFRLVCVRDRPSKQRNDSSYMAGILVPLPLGSDSETRKMKRVGPIEVEPPSKASFTPDRHPDSVNLAATYLAFGPSEGSIHASEAQCKALVKG